ncbi:hypothetical protein C8F04DRAFT_1081240, partial [Mycena alexandri]
PTTPSPPPPWISCPSSRAPVSSRLPPPPSPRSRRRTNATLKAILERISARSGSAPPAPCPANTALFAAGSQRAHEADSVEELAKRLYLAPTSSCRPSSPRPPSPRLRRSRLRPAAAHRAGTASSWAPGVQPLARPHRPRERGAFWSHGLGEGAPQGAAPAHP